MIQKILIANRGEIATRIIKTCQNMNIKTVAVYSEADKNAPYVQRADESYLLGPPPAPKSYMNIEQILKIAQKAKVDAIHPGYGFLSENAQFAHACEKNGILFIGPSADVIQKMGHKLAARKIMHKQQIPIIPGTNVSLEEEADALKAARELGFPLMLKAVAGGGGVGMVQIHNETELKEQFHNYVKRAQSLFGDGSLYVEKVIENARHIEVQVIADHHGNFIHLYDRECSIQRRHQKIVEEAPAPSITSKTRQKITKAAIKAAKAIDYVNAGTVEFLVDEEENFYFLEMNTRLQVEHPITEEITGIDLVKAQIQVANKQPLPFKQADISYSGHAIETRIYAEDPETFFPSPGTIKDLVLPKGKQIRHELGIEKDSEVTPFYDPMIAKLIVSASNRQEVLKLLGEALEGYVIEGIKTNIPLLQKILTNKQFHQGNVTTDFINQLLKS